jgi:hypothetical protein
MASPVEYEFNCPGQTNLDDGNICIGEFIAKMSVWCDRLGAANLVCALRLERIGAVCLKTQFSSLGLVHASGFYVGISIVREVSIK